MLVKECMGRWDSRFKFSRKESEDTHQIPQWKEDKLCQGQEIREVSRKTKQSPPNKRQTKPTNNKT